VDEGFVLGAASVTIDVKEDLAVISKMNAWIWVGQVVLQILLFVVLGVIVRRLLRQIGGEPALAIEIANRISDGDLTTELVVAKGDTSSLFAATKRMVDTISHIIGEAMTASNALTNAAAQVSATTQSLSQILPAGGCDRADQRQHRTDVCFNHSEHRKCKGYRCHGE
jgi:methyl-accepting chemotaxis protein